MLASAEFCNFNQSINQFIRIAAANAEELQTVWILPDPNIFVSGRILPDPEKTPDIRPDPDPDPDPVRL